MTRNEEHRKYFELLELPPGSTITEITVSYNHLKELYSRESIVTSPLADELSDEQRKEILKQVKEAYDILMESLTSVTSVEGKMPAPGLSDGLLAGIADAFFSGETLKMIREQMGISLHDVELTTKVRAEYLKNIELEQYEVLPEEVFVRGYLQTFAKYLSLSPHKVLADYMKGYDRWKKERENKSR